MQDLHFQTALFFLSVSLSFFLEIDHAPTKHDLYLHVVLASNIVGKDMGVAMFTDNSVCLTVLYRRR